MKLTTLKVTISLVCAAFLILHLLLPATRIDAVTLGLLVVALLPWFQPLLKSLELPGGLKIELQDVQAATDIISSTLTLETSAKVEDIQQSENGHLSFINKVAEQDPNLALVGLRIEIEKLLIEIARDAGLTTDKWSINTTLNKLSQRGIIPSAVAIGLTQFISLGNQAAHGAIVSKDAAAWVLAIAPQFLNALSALRSKSSETVTLEGEVPKAQILAAQKTGNPITITYPEPFVTKPNVRVGFYGTADEPLSSGLLEAQQQAENGFLLYVISMPDAHSVSVWSVKWKATGKTK